MILTDKPYIEKPPDNTPLMHYLNLYQLLSMLKSKQLLFSSVSLYKDALEATLTSPSYKEVSKYLLWEDNTPVKKDEGYEFARKHATDTSKKFLYDHYWKRGWITDTFESLINNFLRHFIFIHCWSIADTEDVLMWDRYKHQDATIAIKTTMSRMENAFSQTKYPLYIGKIQYTDYQKDHITGFEEFTEKNLSDPDTVEELFYQPIFHKELLYQSENEVRLIISYKYATDTMVGKTYLTDIPYYNYDWGFKHEYNNYDRPDPLWFDTGDDFMQVHRRIPVEVDIDEVIEKIILSPYTESYALSLIQDVVSQYGIDRNKVVSSSVIFS